MNRSFVKYTSLIGSGIFLALFWWTTLPQILKGNVSLQVHGGGRLGSAVGAFSTDMLCLLIPMTVLWGMGFYRYCIKRNKGTDVIENKSGNNDAAD